MTKLKTSHTAWPWLSLSVLIIALDQWTKYLVLHHIAYLHTYKFLPFINFTLRFNSGAAFSFLHNAGGWQIGLLATVSIVVSLVLIIWLCRLKRSNMMTALPISLILGGAIGNLIDRIHYGYVIDFIDFHVRHWHFATFNVADAAVSVGAVLLVLRLLYEGITGKS